MAKLEKKSKSSFRERYADKKTKFQIKTKDGEAIDVGLKTQKWVLKHWCVIPATIAIVGIMVAVPIHQNETQQLNNNIASYTKKVSKAKSEYKITKNGLKSEVVKKIVETKVNSATDAGDAVTDAIIKCSTYSNGGEVSSTDYDNAQTVLKKYIDSDAVDDVIRDPWLRANDWSLEFKSYASYEGDTTDVLWVMKDANGGFMGVVTATYNATTDSFSNVSPMYSAAGLSVQNTRALG